MARNIATELGFLASLANRVVEPDDIPLHFPNGGQLQLPGAVQYE
jgi:hypothetical protein